jgi:hypothetical protein
VIGKDLENVIEAELVPAVQNAKRKDPNLTDVQSTAINGIDKKLIECKVLDKSTAEDTIIKVIGKNWEKVIEAELVPAVQKAKMKDPNLTDVQSTAINSIDKKLIECKVLNESTAEDTIIKVIGKDWEKVIEAELVPAVQKAKMKDPNLTDVQSTATDSIDKKLIECKVLNESTAEDTDIISDKNISEKLIKCEVLKNSTAGDIIVNSDKVNKSDPNEHLQCPYCNDKFENTILIFNFHIYQEHKDKKKEYFRKLKKGN